MSIYALVHSACYKGKIIFEYVHTN
jgi:hypothetical protein